MASAREGDIALRLYNKLGTSTDTWSEGSICSQLNVEVLRSIKECFVELQTQVKLKLLLSFFHIPKRNADEWRRELEEILEVAVIDSEPWVAMLAEIMKMYPTTGHFNLDIMEPPENQRITHDLLLDLRKILKKHSELGLLPMECNYLNRNAFIRVAGQQLPTVRHFNLKRKPKAAALRAELMQRSADAQITVKKSQLQTVPVRSRGLPRKTDTIPMKGIPSRNLLSGLRNTALNSSPMNRPTTRPSVTHKDGGIKLVEIKESPIAAQQSRKKRKIQEPSDPKGVENDAKQKDVSSENKEVPNPSVSVTTTAAPVPPPPATPDYAAGLTPSNPPTPSPATTVLRVSSPNIQTLQSSPSVTVTNLSTRGTIQQTSRPISATGVVTLTGSATPRIIMAGSGTSGVDTQTVVYRTVTPQIFATSEVLHATPVSSSTTIEHLVNTGQAQYATLQPLQPDIVYSSANLSTTATTTASVIHPQVITVTPSQSSGVHKQVQTQQPPQQPLLVTTTPSSQQKKGLMLTREQMTEAQEMFQTSNKVTRPEKALILGFMAGSRDNPCPHLGNVITIKLSEGEEKVMQADGSYVQMLAETHFQMNYDTGQWKRIKKYLSLPAAPTEAN